MRETVKVIVDDAMQTNEVVSSGAITLDAVPTSYVEVGLDYTPKVRTLPVELKLPSGTIMAQRIIGIDNQYVFITKLNSKW